MLKRGILVILFLVYFSSIVFAVTYYVSESGNDSAPGTKVQPFQTVRKGIDSTGDGDTVFISSGTYDLSGYSADIMHSLSLIGEDKANTILTNGGTLTFHDSLTVKNLKFFDYSGTVFHPLARSGETIDGVIFDNCIFEDVEGAIVSQDASGVIKNVHISNCDFLNIISETWSAYAINIYHGIITDINIINNSFENIITGNSRKNAIAILIGSNENEDTTEDIYIKNNYMNHIVAGIGGEYDDIEGHGILAYGKNINILDNTVIDLNNANDHEAIYIKGTYSTIANNVIHNGGSKGDAGDICIKGWNNVEDLVYGNRITGDYGGAGIYIEYTEARVENNYINKKSGHGILTWENPELIITNNHIEVKENGIYLLGTDDGEVSNNLVISYDGDTINLQSSSNMDVFGNIECTGQDCSDLIPPNPACQNLGYLCCASCKSGNHVQYDSTCLEQRKCCDECAVTSIPSQCSDDCSIGQRECIDSLHYRTCRNYDSDSCLEWSSSQTCASGQTCYNGVCGTSGGETCSELGGIACCTSGESCLGTSYSGASDCSGTCCSLECTMQSKCGDGNCSISENCNSCPGDCGQCNDILFSSDIFFGNANNWESLNPNRWSVVEDSGDSRYGITTSNFDELSGSRLGEYSLIKDRSYTDFTFFAKVKSTEDFGVNPSADYNIVFGFQDENNYYFIMLNSGSGYSELIGIFKGIRQTIATIPDFTIPDNNYHDIKLERSGDDIKIFFDNVLILVTSDSTFTSGQIGIGGFNDASLWDDIIVTTPFHPADTNNDGCIDVSELVKKINEWKQRRYGIPELMEVIGLWKIGC